MPPKVLPRRTSTAAFTGKATLKIRNRNLNRDEDDTSYSMDPEDSAHELEDISIMLSASNSIVMDNQVVFNYKEMAYTKDQDQLPVFIHYSSDSCVEQAYDPSEKRKTKEQLQNQFNFSNRSTQTPTTIHTSKKVQTEPPIKVNFSANILQWDMYDYYAREAEKNVKESEKQKTASDGSGSIPSKTTEKKSDISILLKSALIMERIVNQNTYDEISQDFRYWEDLSDEYKSGQGSVLPLWKFTYDDVKDLSVTSILWSPRYDDMFIATYGSYNFTTPSNGFICAYSLCNPTHPEYVISTETGTMTIDVHPEMCHLLVAGLYDGNIGVYNILNLPNSPRVCNSSGMEAKHNDVVWKCSTSCSVALHSVSLKAKLWKRNLSYALCVCDVNADLIHFKTLWHTDDIDGNPNFFSISADSRIIRWTLVKNSLRPLKIMTLKLENILPDQMNVPTIQLYATGMAMAFHPKKHSLFLIGTGEGRIYLCDTTYSEGILMEYVKHHQAVYNITWNEFHPEIFASCSPDGTIRIWKQTKQNPICTYDLQSPVGDVQWAPYSSTVFAAVTLDGKIHVYDLNINKYKAICIQTVVPRYGTQLTSIAFSRSHLIVIVGDDCGSVRCLKLSPNLRKGVIDLTDERNVPQEVANFDKYLAVFQET